MARGHTLLELSIVLALAGLAASALVSTGRGLQDRAAVAAARESVAGLVAEARAQAMERGEASVRIADQPWRAWSESRGAVLRAVELERDLGVEILLGGFRTSSELSFDALGIGRVASETVRFRRRGAEASLVISAFGRVRRR